MTLYVLTPQAEDDLFSIWSYIAQDSLNAANKVETEIYAACTFLASNPQVGHVRSDLTDRSVRFWTLPHFSHYVIIYDPACRPLRVIRILHGATDIPRRLATSG